MPIETALLKTLKPLKFRGIDRTRKANRLVAPDNLRWLMLSMFYIFVPSIDQDQTYDDDQGVSRRGDLNAGLPKLTIEPGLEAAERHQTERREISVTGVVVPLTGLLCSRHG
ncbi:MAG TPA: hypothetical protein VIM04_01225 [Candidatus Binatia bacterium]|jgi:hypothetical protein